MNATILFQSLRTLDEQCEELLDILPQSGSKAFQLFCEALKADGQEEIVSLYLKPTETESSSNETKPAGVEESGGSATVSSQNSVTRETTAQASSASQVAAPSDSNTINTATVIDGSSNSVHLRQTVSPSRPGAVCEETRQQYYRHSVEPVQSTVFQQTSEPNEHEARFLYRSQPYSPKTESLYSLIADNSYSRSEKERMLLEMGVHLPVTDLLQRFGACDSKFNLLREYGNSKYESLIVKDSGPGPENLNFEVTSTFNQRSVRPPHVFKQSPGKSSIPSRVQNQGSIGEIENLENKQTFVNSSKQLHSLNENNCFPGKVVNDCERQLKDSPNRLIGNVRQEVREVVNRSPSLPSRQFTASSDDGFKLREAHYNSQTSLTPSTLPGREFYEMPRHVEVNSKFSDERCMVSFPRHVEQLLPVSHHPDLYQEEFSSRAENPQSRLVRNDSVGKKQLYYYM